MVDKVQKVMHEFKHGELHSGSKSGPVVKKRKQAVAIALDEQRRASGTKKPSQTDMRNGYVRRGSARS